MEYRIDKSRLLDIVGAWDSFLRKKVHLIACGGTALTLLDIKASTKDIDLLVPVLNEYDYLIGHLKELGYKAVSGWGWTRGDGFVFEFFRGKTVHTTELIESPLKKNNHLLFKEFSHIYLGILNYYDLMISKLFRGTAVDVEDCLSLVKNKIQEIDLKRFVECFHNVASFDISEEKINKNLEYFLKRLNKEGLYHEKRRSS